MHEGSVILRAYSDRNITLRNKLTLSHHQKKSIKTHGSVLAVCGPIPCINNVLELYKDSDLDSALGDEIHKYHILVEATAFRKMIFEEYSPMEGMKDAQIAIAFRKGILHIGHDYAYISDRPYIALGNPRSAVEGIIECRLKEGEVVGHEDYKAILTEAIKYNDQGFHKELDIQELALKCRQ